MEPEEVKGPCVSRSKTAAQPFTLSRCTSWAGRHCSSARFDCQLSGKACEDSDCTSPSCTGTYPCGKTVSAVIIFSLPFGIPFAHFDSLWKSRHLVPLPLRRFLYLFVHPSFPEIFGNLRTLINSYS